MNGVRHDYFDTWSPNMAWLLGYIWTDGSIKHRKWSPGKQKINELSLRCSVKDEHIIHDIKRELNFPHPVRRYKTTVSVLRSTGEEIHSGDIVGIYVTSEPIVETLINRFGILPRKTWIDSPMPDIPDEFLCHFTRGVIDGDGTICRTARGRTQINVLGTRQFVFTLRDRVCNATKIPFRGRPSYCPHTQQLWQFIWAGQRDISAILQWLYPAGEYLHLRRKRAVAEEHFAAPPVTASRKGFYTESQWAEMISARQGGMSLEKAAAIHGASREALRYRINGGRR